MGLDWLGWDGLNKYSSDEGGNRDGSLGIWVGEGTSNCMLGRGNGL